MLRLDKPKGRRTIANAGDADSIPGLGRPLGEGNGNPHQYSCLEKSHGQRSLMGYNPWGRKRVGHKLAAKQLYSTGNSSQYSLMIYVGKHFKKEYSCI